MGLCACCLPLFWQPASAHAAEQTSETTYLIPEYQSGIQRPSLLLNGTWDFKYTEKDRWEPILVPGEPAMQGYAIRHDQPFFYRKTFTVPADFKGQTVILRFDGVYSHARLFVNGKFVREHFGGFSRWETDVTDFVKAGRKNEIRLEVTDRLDEISYASVRIIPSAASCGMSPSLPCRRIIRPISTSRRIWMRSIRMPCCGCVIR